ncbi:MAG: AAA family ATPase [Chitinivibrionales bacterium]|nr:AAA family ATPase [Chitinivibrionales bacterium]
MACYIRGMKRAAYRYLVEWKGKTHRNPLVLRGARQVGKTWLLKEFAAREFDSVFYVNFEENDRFSDVFEHDLRPSRILDDLSFLFERPFRSAGDILILDEIQRCPRALTALKYFAEEAPDTAVCAAGSLLGVVLGDDSFPVGKVEFLDLYPFSFSEFLNGVERERLAAALQAVQPGEVVPHVAHEKLWELWKHYLVVGGLPAVITAYRESLDGGLYTAFQRVRAVQRNLIDSYNADIAKHSGKTNALHVDRVWRNVPAQLARNQQRTTSRFYFRDVIPGVRGYERLAGPIEWLESAGLLLRCSMVEAPARPLSSRASHNRFKLYMADIGLLGALSGIKPGEFLAFDFGSYKGYVAENFVAQELRAAGERELYFWQGRTSEVEFLLQRHGYITPLEVKAGARTRSRSLSAYEQRYTPVLGVIASARPGGRDDNRVYVPVYAVSRLEALKY